MDSLFVDTLAAQFSEDAQSLQTNILSLLNKSPAAHLLKNESTHDHPLLQAHNAELVAKQNLHSAKEKVNELAKAKALVDHAKNKWIAEANRNISAAESKLQSAIEYEEVEQARKELQHWQNNRCDGERALEERTANLSLAEEGHGEAEMEMKMAEEEMCNCKLRTDRTLCALLEELGDVLGKSGLDGDLALYEAFSEGNPQILAQFSAQGDEQQILVSNYLTDRDLLVEMSIADGPRGGYYARSMEIYECIRSVSSHVDSSRQAAKAGTEDNAYEKGIFHRLALAVSLEHAEPYTQRNPEACTSHTSSPEFIDPIARYLHFETAYLNAELDPAFPTLTTWELRFVVDGEHGTPDECFSWGREMLRNYRPDLILKKDYQWRYVEAVRTEIKYGSEEGKFDKKELHFFQNVLMNGGVCGRRAFFGRFILRAFGIPTIARPSPGHGALAHWTPSEDCVGGKGWVVCLGPGWGHGHTKTRYGKDLDFLEHTRARVKKEDFKKIMRARWIGTLLGYGKGGRNNGRYRRCWNLSSAGRGLQLWDCVALYLQRHLAEANLNAGIGNVVRGIRNMTTTPATIDLFRSVDANPNENITIGEDGTISIPACATSNPSQPTGKILFMKSSLGGRQLHYNRNGPHQAFEYTFETPQGGTYALTARVVTPSWRQSLLLSVNGNEESIEIPLPFTVGMWDTTEPMNIELKRGVNVLRFSREGDIKGVTVKDFTLKFVDWCLD